MEVASISFSWNQNSDSAFEIISVQDGDVSQLIFEELRRHDDAGARDGIDNPRH
jgi:hypothetical protein